MMNYTEVSIDVPNQIILEELMAILSDADYEGFEEKESKLLAYIPVNRFDAAVLNNVLSAYNVTYSLQEIAQQNWNAQWEESFEPVIVDDFCVVRADFHKPLHTTVHEIIITPKMSFGTGHHATTFLMMRNMRHVDFNGKKVFDFGTGTGILAILAEKLGASQVVAIDNDEWSFLNAKENTVRNSSQHIQLQQGSIGDVSDNDFGIILANINRHILLHYMQDMYNRLTANGCLLMSGLLIDDETIIIQAAEKVGFNTAKVEVLNNWISVMCVKHTF